MSKEKIATEWTGTATRPLSTTRMTGTWSGTLHQWYLYTDILYCNSLLSKIGFGKLGESD